MIQKLIRRAPYVLLPAFVLTSFMLSSCAVTPTKASAGAYKMSNGTSFALTDAWTHIPASRNSTTGSIFTKDGVTLNRIYVNTVEDKKPLFVNYNGLRTLPVYHKGNSALQHIDFITSNLTLLGMKNIQTENAAPATISGKDGLTFELTGKYPDGLNLKGKVGLVETEKGLNIIAYIAPAIHYYERDKDGVEKIISTVSFP